MDAAARLIYERGVAGTTLDDVKAAGVSACVSMDDAVALLHRAVRAAMAGSRY